MSREKKSSGVPKNFFGERAAGPGSRLFVSIATVGESEEQHEPPPRPRRP
jgi:hypothetical protein